MNFLKNFLRCCVYFCPTYFHSFFWFGAPIPFCTIGHYVWSNLVCMISLLNLKYDGRCVVHMIVFNNFVWMCMGGKLDNVAKSNDQNFEILKVGLEI